MLADSRAAGRPTTSTTSRTPRSSTTSTRRCKANVMFKRDIDYIVKDDKVVIIDEFTGRMMDGRRWSNGLHQAVEAKEGVEIEPENQTMASITFQNYFRMYPKLSGMTGTAATEAAEFWDIYKMNVVEIPTNVAGPADRRGGRVLQEHRRQVPGDRQVDPRKAARPASRCWSAPCRSRSPSCCRASSTRKASSTRCSTPASTSMEAHIVAQAGPARRGHHRHQHGRARHRHPARRQRRVPHRGRAEGHARGGPERDAAIDADQGRSRRREARKVLEAGGLFVLGTERHESRRIDNQLRGRSGRQGDPGPVAGSTCASRTTCCASSGRTRCSPR